MPKLWQKSLAEFVASFIFVFVGAGTILSGHSVVDSIGVLGIALAHGIIFMALFYAIRHISGGHINPAITIAHFVTGRIGFISSLSYIFSQLAGAVAAAFFLLFIFPFTSQALYLGTPTLGFDVGVGLAVFIEAVLTFILVFVYFGASADKRAEDAAAGLAIGLVITAGYLVANSLTGAAMNPARVFGPALVSGFWANHMIYWVGPALGAMGAALLYSYAFIREPIREE